MAYRHLTRSEREKIAVYREEGYNFTDISKKLKRTTSTITRELKRNSCSSKIGYIAEFAQHHTERRRCLANSKQEKIAEDSHLMKYIVEKLRARWSPEDIAQKLVEQSEQLNLPLVSVQTIYTWIKKRHPEMKRYLSVLRKKKPKPKGMGKRRIIANRRSIEERPEEVNNRSRIGDWEGDTIVSGCRKRSIATFTERHSRFMLAKNMQGRDAEGMHQATVNAFSHIPKEKRLTCTDDNGTEFSEHEKTEKELDMKIYFAHPYCSYERGSNERNNRELRRFFPKGTNFSEIPDWELDWAIRLINNKPRKVLNYRTASEVFFEK